MEESKQGRRGEGGKEGGTEDARKDGGQEGRKIGRNGWRETTGE